MFWLVKLLLTSTLVLVVIEAIAYEGYKLYEVSPSSVEQADVLYELSKKEGYDLLVLKKIPNHPAKLIVAPEVESDFLTVLKENQLSYGVVEDNIGKVIEKEFKKNLLLKHLGERFGGKGRLSTERYYNHQEINDYIEVLAERYPTRVFIKTVGKSFEGRLLKTITITNGDGRSGKNVIFMDGGFHAREWISPAAVLYVIEQLVENYPENADMLLDYDWVILPVVNADGYEYSQLSSTTRLWRKTRQPSESNGKICYGTDPNRNFDFHWNEEGASDDPCSDIFAGPHAFSEPETITVRDLMYSLKGRGKMYLTIHSYGKYLLYPWGWTSDLPDTWEDLDEVASAGGDAIKEATGTKYSVGSSTNVLYIAAGASDDYAFYAGFPISITMELPGGGIFGFNPPASSIDRLVKETWIGIAAMARKVVEKYPLEQSN